MSDSINTLVTYYGDADKMDRKLYVVGAALEVIAKAWTTGDKTSTSHIAQSFDDLVKSIENQLNKAEE